MEHEVFVPVPVPRLRAVLADPERVARAVPGFQQDAGAEPVAGRLKLRIGGTSITYRGALRVQAREDGSYAVEGEAGESRGTGSVKLALTLRLRDAGGATALGLGGTASGDGRVADLDADSVRTAAVRLLDRFARNLAAEAGREDGPGTGPESAAGLATEDFEPLATGDFEAAPDADDAPVPPPPAESAAPGSASVSGAEVPPPSPDPSADDASEESDEYDEYGTYDGDAQAADVGAAPRDTDGVTGPGGFGETAGPPAEAAHARRTMIGRSAEEVDHAPPRGRYAPVPAPLTVSAGSALRWAAPAAALAVAGAIVMGRALRRRR